MIVNVSMARELEKNICFGGPVARTEDAVGIACGGVIPIYRDAVGEPGVVDTSRPLLDGISTDGIIRVEDLLTDDLELLGKRALKGLPNTHPMENGELKSTGGTVLLAGEEFGKGSSREQAVWALLEAGISAVVAKSVGPIFKKNAAYVGLLVSTDTGLARRINAGEPVPLEAFLADYDPLHSEIIKAGGLFGYLRLVNEGKIPEPVIGTPAGTPMNVYEQRVARAMNVAAVKPGDYGLLTPDLVFSYVGLSGLAEQTMLREYGRVQRKTPSENILLFNDHFRRHDSKKPTIGQLIDNQREFARELGLPEENYYDEKRGGICHSEVKDLRDPRVCKSVAGTDSHTPTSDSRPVLAFPIGSSMFGAAVAEGKIPFSVGKTLLVNLTGELPAGVSIRDAQLQWARSYKEELKERGLIDIPDVVELAGPALDKLSLEDVEAICNMVPEVWMAEVAAVPAFRAGVENLVKKWKMSGEEASELYGYPQPGCDYALRIEYDLRMTVPGVALPGNPSNFMALSQLEKHPLIDLAFIGSCTNGYEAVEEAAAVLMGRKVKTKLVIVPSSSGIREMLERAGILKILAGSGVEIEGVSACSTCIGSGPNALKAGETGISATNRNFPGRMGDKSAEAYLGSPLLTAMTAMMGKIPTASEYRSEMERVEQNFRILRGA